MIEQTEVVLSLAPEISDDAIEHAGSTTMNPIPTFNSSWQKIC